MRTCFSLKPFGGHQELHHGLTRKQMTVILTQSVVYWMIYNDLPPMREALFYNIEGEDPIGEMDFPKRSYFDLLSLDKNGNIISIEIKSSEADFMADKKWDKYLEYCNQFYFAFPLGFPDRLIPSNESIGILRVSGDKVEVVRNPKQRKIKSENRAEVLYRAHMKSMSRLCRFIELDIRKLAGDRGLPHPDLLEIDKYHTPFMFWEIYWELNEKLKTKLPFVLKSKIPFASEDGWRIEFNEDDWIKVTKPIRKRISDLSVSYLPLVAIEKDVTGKTKRCRIIRAINILLNPVLDEDNFEVQLNEIVQTMRNG